MHRLFVVVVVLDHEQLDKEGDHHVNFVQQEITRTEKVSVAAIPTALVRAISKERL